MAHKTLVNGAAYEVTGGKTLAEGVGYGIAGGKTLINGAAYDISFGSAEVKLTLSGSFNKTYAYVSVNGVNYTSATELTVPAGTECTVYVSTMYTNYRDNCYVTVNGETVQQGYGGYVFQITEDTGIVMTKTPGTLNHYYYAEITTS